MTTEQTGLIERLRERARIRRQIPTRKSVQEGQPDRIADLLEEAAAELERATNSAGRNTKFSDFIRNASPEEKQRVYEEVGRKAAERQNATALPGEPKLILHSAFGLVKKVVLKSDYDSLRTAAESRIAALREQLECHIDILKQTQRERDAAHKARERAEANEARYLWIRAASVDADISKAFTDICESEPATPELFDAAIDAALAGAQEEGR
jgi:hypothetical protein